MRGPRYISIPCKQKKHSDCDGSVPRQEYNDDKLARRLAHAAHEDHTRIIRDWQENNSHDHPCDCECGHGRPVSDKPKRRRE
jgi:hypothetical protein